jgi:hypothetical protein
VRRLPVFVPEPRIQPMLRRIRVWWHRDVETAETQIRGADKDEQAFNRLDAGPKITKAAQYQVPAREDLQRTLVHGVDYSQSLVRFRIPDRTRDRHFVRTA